MSAGGYAPSLPRVSGIKRNQRFDHVLICFQGGNAVMYKYLLCWRYLRTRYIALASVVSVMLGVATMIVVNSVMAGFSDTMRTRLHGVLADVVVESYSIDGFYDSDEVVARIKDVAGD